MFSPSVRLAQRAGTLGLLVLALVLAVGCSGKTKGAKVSGTVMYKDAPVTGGSLGLVPVGTTKGEGAVILEIQGDGTFKGEAPPGNYKVTVSTDSVPEGVGEVPAGVTLPKDVQVKAPPAGTSIRKRVHIPPQYKDPDKTPETWEIKKGEANKREIILKD